MRTFDFLLTFRWPVSYVWPASGHVIVTRWSEWPIASDALLPRTTKVTVLRNAYTYDASSADSVDWSVLLFPPRSYPCRHVNFADPNMFVAYSGPLFAQDEIQVMEHPTLASVREYLLDKKVRSAPALMLRLSRFFAFHTLLDEREWRTTATHKA